MEIKNVTSTEIELSVEDVNRLTETIERRNKTGDPQTITFEILKKDGEVQKEITMYIAGGKAPGYVNETEAEEAETEEDSE